MDVRAPRRPEIDGAKTAGTIAVEEHPVLVARQGGNALDRGSVNRRAEIDGRPPSAAGVRPLRRQRPLGRRDRRVGDPAAGPGRRRPRIHRATVCHAGGTGRGAAQGRQDRGNPQSNPHQGKIEVMRQKIMRGERWDGGDDEQHRPFGNGAVF